MRDPGQRSSVSLNLKNPHYATSQTEFVPVDIDTHYHSDRSQSLLVDRISYSTDIAKEHDRPDPGNRVHHGF